MHRQWVKWLPELLAVMLLVTIAAGCGKPGMPPGKQAPSFSLMDVNQRQLSFPDGWRGKKVALVFFSSG